jgi:hypothetical protein
MAISFALENGRSGEIRELPVYPEDNRVGERCRGRKNAEALSAGTKSANGHCKSRTNIF